MNAGIDFRSKIYETENINFQNVDISSLGIFFRNLPQKMEIWITESNPMEQRKTKVKLKNFAQLKLSLNM